MYKKLIQMKGASGKPVAVERYAVIALAEVESDGKTASNIYLNTGLILSVLHSTEEVQSMLYADVKVDDGL